MMLELENKKIYFIIIFILSLIVYVYIDTSVVENRIILKDNKIIKTSVILDKININPISIVNKKELIKKHISKEEKYSIFLQTHFNIEKLKKDLRKKINIIFNLKFIDSEAIFKIIHNGKINTLEEHFGLVLTYIDLQEDYERDNINTIFEISILLLEFEKELRLNNVGIRSRKNSQYIRETIYEEMDRLIYSSNLQLKRERYFGN